MLDLGHEFFRAILGSLFQLLSLSGNENMNHMIFLFHYFHSIKIFDSFDKVFWQGSFDIFRKCPGINSVMEIA